MRSLFRDFVVGRQRVEREHDARVWLAWHIAALTRGTKGLPKLETMLSRKHTSGRQSAKEQVALWQAFAASVGGRFVPVKGES